ncbi:DUF4189 domain-containing protein [Lysobacter capsici]|uniref:DUF4189 domain-containing protein n=1 Tax=Lysobacter capsici TaxID=435897 RepID=UPI0006279BC0|nr:DUF4189 domain-containing protein [Lysobacter capsici]
MLVKSRNIFAVLFLFSTVVQAEQGCPDGLYPGGAAPGQICVPIPGYGLGGNAQAQPPRWATRWGAIATDDGSTGGGILGQSEALSSRRQAENAALSDCRSKGGNNCALVQAYHDQCIAVAWGRSRPYSVSAENSKVASELALAKCGQSDQACGIYYTGCSYPERVQ